MRLLAILSSMALLSCAATMPPPPALTTTPRPPVPLMAPVPSVPSTLVFTGSTARNVGEALQEALQTPEPWRVQGGTLVYTAYPQARYLVYVAVDRVTTLRFAPGEVYFATVSGLPKCDDLKTANAEVNIRCLVTQETVRGEGEAQQAQVSLRPGADGLKTNVMVTTSWGAYDLEVVSRQGRYLPVVQWEHPTPLVPSAPLPAPEILGLGYAMTSRRETVPGWMPDAMWDDRKHTYLRFPETIGAMKLPLLYTVVPQTMEEILVNYRVYEGGRLMVADGVFDGAVLRVGKDPTAELVDLRRTADYQYVTCPQDPLCPRMPSRVVGR